MDSLREDMDVARKVADKFKRNGEFDKCRREVLAKVVVSDCMIQSLESCKKIVKQCIRNAPPNFNILKLREMVKEQIRRKGIIFSLLNCAEKEFKIYEYNTKFNEMIEEITRAELDLPPRDSNIELVDMEVSNGASSSSSIISAYSSNHMDMNVSNENTEQLNKKSSTIPLPSSSVSNSLTKQIDSNESQTNNVLFYPTAPSFITTTSKQFDSNFK